MANYTTVDCLSFFDSDVNKSYSWCLFWQMKRVCRVAQLVVALLNRNSHVVATTGTLVYVHYNDTKANRVQVAPINQHEFFMNQQQVLLQPLIALSVSMRAKRTRKNSAGLEVITVGEFQKRSGIS